MTHTAYHIASAGFEAARQTVDLPLHGHSFRVSALASSRGIVKELNEVSKSLNYKYLNDLSNVTSDLALSLKIAEQLPNAEELRLSSAPDRGIVLVQGRSLLWLHRRFEAAHHLPNVPAGHKCGRLHGHGFQVTLYAESLSSHAELDVIWQRQAALLDQQYLNKIAGLENPTSEVLAQWLWQRIKSEFDALALVVVQETVTAGCSFDGETHRIWKQQDAECALYIPGKSDPYGHSYTVRLHLQAPLDEVMGWTVDYGDVKALFKPAYERLDHHCINELLGDAEPTAANVARWLMAELNGVLPPLYRIDVLQSPTYGAVLETAMENDSSIASSPRLMI